MEQSNRMKNKLSLKKLLILGGNPETGVLVQIANKLDYELSEREKEVSKIYKTLNSLNRHKMLPIPVCKIPKDYLR